MGTDFPDIDVECTPDCNGCIAFTEVSDEDLVLGSLVYEQDVRMEIVEALLDKALTAGVFQGKSLSPDNAGAIMALASYIENGVAA